MCGIPSFTYSIGFPPPPRIYFGLSHTWWDMLCAKQKVRAKICIDSFCLLKHKHKGNEFSVWLNEPPCRSQRWSIVCLLKCSRTVWCPTAAKFYPQVRSHPQPGIPGKSTLQPFQESCLCASWYFITANKCLLWEFVNNEQGRDYWAIQQPWKRRRTCCGEAEASLCHIMHTPRAMPHLWCFPGLLIPLAEAVFAFLKKLIGN